MYRVAFIVGGLKASTQGTFYRFFGFWCIVKSRGSHHIIRIWEYIHYSRYVCDRIFGIEDIEGYFLTWGISTLIIE